MPVILLLALVIASMVLGPLLTIWAVNLLFGLSIPVTLGTWFAVAWIQIILSGGIKFNYKKNTE